MNKYKEIIDSIKRYLPDSSIRLEDILQELLKEVEFVIESFSETGFLPIELSNIYDQLEEIIEDFKLGYGQLNLLEGIETINTKKLRPNYESLAVDNTVPHTLLEDFTHIRPYGFVFANNELIEANSWKSLYIKSCELFYNINPNKFMSFENKTYLNGETKDYFSKEEGNIDLPVRLFDKIYISTRFDANGFRDMLINIIKEYGFNVEDFKVYFRADYRPLHK